MTPIGALKLNPDTIGLLVKADIKTVEALTSVDGNYLRHRVPNFSRRHLNEVKGALEKKGLALAP